MQKELILKPEELYYLGNKVKAKYIDYTYIAGMKDIQKNYELYESNVRNSLEKQGFIQEDFSGEIEISDYVKRLVEPIFFGEFESEIDECTIDEEKKVNSIKFHYLNGDYIGVVIEDELLKIRKYSRDEIITCFLKLLGSVSEEENTGKPIFDRKKVKKIIILKSVTVGKVSNIKLLFQDEQCTYEEDADERIVAKMNKELLDTAKKILWEDDYGI